MDSYEENKREWDGIFRYNDDDDNSENDIDVEESELEKQQKVYKQKRVKNNRELLYEGPYSTIARGETEEEEETHKRAIARQDAIKKFQSDIKKLESTMDGSSSNEENKKIIKESMEELFKEKSLPFIGDHFLFK